MVPLQVPGTTELIIVLLNLVIVAGFIGGIVFLLRRYAGSDEDEQIEELERRVEELEREKES